MQSGDLSEVKRILNTSADVDREDKGIVDQRNEQSHAPLHLACATGHMYVCMFVGPLPSKQCFCRQIAGYRRAVGDHRVGQR